MATHHSSEGVPFLRNGRLAPAWAGLLVLAALTAGCGGDTAIIPPEDPIPAYFVFDSARVEALNPLESRYYLFVRNEGNQPGILRVRGRSGQGDQATITKETSDLALTARNTTTLEVNFSSETNWIDLLTRAQNSSEYQFTDSVRVDTVAPYGG